MKIYLFFLFLFSFSLCQGQELYHRILNADNGLPSNKVHSVYEDSKGYIWFGTENGVCRWDSKNFVTYTIKDGLPNNEVYVIYEDSKGRIWFSTFSNELCYLQNDTIFNRKNDKRLEKISIIKGSPLNEVNGNLICYGGENYSLLSININNFSIKRMPHLYLGNALILNYKKRFLFCLYIQRGFRNEMNIAYMDSIYYFFNKNISVENDSLFKIVDYKDYKGCLLAKEGLFGYITNFCHFKWSYADYLKGPKFKSQSEVHNFFRLQANKNQTKTTDQAEPILKLRLPRKNDLLDFTVFKSAPLSMYKDEIWNASNTLLHLNSELLQSLRSRHILVLRSKMNIIYFHELTTFNFGMDLTDNSLHKIYKYRNHLYLIYENALLVNLSNKSRSYLPIDEKLYGIDYGHNGKLYLTSSKSILNIETQKSITNKYNNIFSFFKGFSYSSKRRLYTINNSSQGLYIQDLNHKATKVSDLYAYTSFIDSRGRLWIGTVNKLYVTNTFLPKVEGEKEIKLNKDLDIFCSEIKEDQRGNIFFTTNDGVYIIDKNDNKYHIDDKNFLSSNECVTLKLDTQNHSFFVATRNGVNQISYFNENGQLKFNVINKFFKDDGLSSNEIKDILIDGDSLWVATAKGLDLINNKKFRPDTLKIPIHFNKIVINDSAWRLDSFYRLNHDQNNIKIDYSAIYYQRRDRLDIFYSLIKDGDTTTGKLENTVLPLLSQAPGDYTLQLYAYDRDYPYIKSDFKSLRFHISPPYYKTWWFYLLILLASLGIVAGLLWYRNKNREEQLKLVGELNKYKLQGLQHQMNPHFVFNSMSTIQDLILTEQNVDALDFISDFSHLMRTMLQNSRNESISLSQEITFLKRYIELEQIRYSQTFDYKLDINVPEEELNDIYLPTMMVQPIVENAIKHGVSNLKERRGLITIQFSLNEDETFLTVEVIDNGAGKSSSSKVKNHTSTAINVIQERLLIYEKNGNKGDYTISYSENGTKAILKLPI